MNSESRSVRLALFGLGTVGRLLLQHLVQRKAQLASSYGLAFSVNCVADSSGIAISEDGFDLPAVIAHKSAGSPVRELPGYQADATPAEALGRARSDIVLEASPLNLESGEPGIGHARTALRLGQHLVLANKSPLALAQAELEELAADAGCGMLYSATFCGGLPVLNILRRDMVCGEVTRFRGIFNGTTNFMLEALLNGHDYASALQKAQDVGAAEADPGLDVGGWDTAAKLVIAANNFCAPMISLADVEVTGIENVMAAELQQCQNEGQALKLLASAERLDGRWSFSVKPTAVPLDSFLGGCTGWEMAVEIESDIYGKSFHKLYEREPIPTAASMLRDVVHLAIAGRQAAVQARRQE